MSRSVILAVLAVALSSSPAFAQTPVMENQAVIALGTQLAQQVTMEKPDLPIAFNVEVRGQVRPAALLPLYALQGALQGLDVYTTVRALDSGRGRETNPLLKSGNHSLMIGAKIAVLSGNVFLVEKLWKKHPRTAVGLMIVINVFMTGVVANNALIGSR